MENNYDENKLTSAEIPAQKKRGRPKKSEQGIAKPSGKKRGRPRKDASQTPKPVGRDSITYTDVNEIVSKYPNPNRVVRQKDLTAKQMQEKLKQERKERQKLERKNRKLERKIIAQNARQEEVKIQKEYINQEQEHTNPEYVQQEYINPGYINQEYLQEQVEQYREIPKKKSKKIKFKKGFARKIITLCLIVVFLFSGSVVINWLFSTSRTKKKYDEIASKVMLVGEKENSRGSTFDTINFQELKTLTGDAIAWIKIANTEINYPIVQTTNNEYYLNYDVYNNKDNCGSIFMDYRNDKRFTDVNTVIYGHNIKRGLMFADLEKIASGELGNNIDIYIYTSDKSMRFKVFSTYVTIPEEYSINTDITSKEYDLYIEKLKEKSEIKFEANPESSYRLITLSTCDDSGKERIIVHAALEDID